MIVDFCKRRQMFITNTWFTTRDRRGWCTWKRPGDTGRYLTDYILTKCKYWNHSVAQLCVHCCKGDTASQWEIAILGVSEVCNPWTDWLKIWHMWLRRSVYHVCQISKNSEAQGLVGNMVKLNGETLHTFYIFLWEISGEVLQNK